MTKAKMALKMRFNLSAMRLALAASALACAALAAGSEPAPAPAPQPNTTANDLAAAQSMERVFKNLARRVAPCVVNLHVRLKEGTWQEELRRISEMAPSSPGEYEGSGVLVDAAGYIITNEHLIRDSHLILATLSDGRVCRAEVRGTDPRSDLAMLKLSGPDAPQNLPCAELADSDTVEVGQWVMVVGNPFGMANSFSVGIVSARNRQVPMQGLQNDVFYGDLIQTDAWINPGNSGGPLFDLRGQLIGINTMIFSMTGTHQGCGFAIPSNHLKPRLEQLKKGLEIEYGWLGVQLQDLKPDEEAFKVPENKGVRINGVIPNTPADRAGLEQGMIILAYNGNRIANANSLIAAVNKTPVGQMAKIQVLNRQGHEAEFSVRISKRFAEITRRKNSLLTFDDDDSQLDDEEEQKPAGKRTAGEAFDKTYSWRGMQVRERPASQFAKERAGVEIVRVKKGSLADRAGLYEGTVIMEMKYAGNQAIQKIETLEDFKRLTSQITGQAALFVPLDGYVTVEAK
jgi:serine protease Do